jgi:hypothetical protein
MAIPPKVSKNYTPGGPSGKPSAIGNTKEAPQGIPWGASANTLEENYFAAAACSETWTVYQEVSGTMLRTRPLSAT